MIEFIKWALDYNSPAWVQALAIITAAVGGMAWLFAVGTSIVEESPIFFALTLIPFGAAWWAAVAEYRRRK